MSLVANKLLCTAALVLALGAQAWNVPGPNFTGDGTFYSLGSNTGQCGFEAVSGPSYKQLPFATGIDVFVALNSKQYANTSSCGQCVVFQGLGTGSGTTPISPTPQYGMVSDLCPECNTGDLDLDEDGDGRFQIGWTPVECAVGSSNLQYAFEGSNAYYLKVKVLNARVPTSAMSAEVGGSMQPMTPTQDNAFLLTTGGPFVFPLAVQLTSIQGATITDTLPTGPTGTVQGSAQYPASGLMQVNTASTSAGVQSGTTGQVQACNITLEAFSACGGINVGAGDTAIPGACCPDGFICARQNPWYWQCVREAQGDTTPPPTPVPAPQGFASQSRGYAPTPEGPQEAPAGQGAPAQNTLPSPAASSSVLCQLVQELLDVPSLASSCAWGPFGMGA